MADVMRLPAPGSNHRAARKSRGTAKPGPDPKAGGNTVRTTARLVNTHHAHFKRIVDELNEFVDPADPNKRVDIPLSDYIAFVMAKAHALEVPDYLEYIQDRIDGKPSTPYVQEDLGLAL